MRRVFKYWLTFNNHNELDRSCRVHEKMVLFERSYSLTYNQDSTYPMNNRNIDNRQVIQVLWNNVMLHEHCILDLDDKIQLSPNRSNVTKRIVNSFSKLLWITLSKFDIYFSMFMINHHIVRLINYTDRIFDIDVFIRTMKNLLWHHDAWYPYCDKNRVPKTRANENH